MNNNLNQLERRAVSKLEVNFFVLLYFLCFLCFNIFWPFCTFVLLYFYTFVLLYFCTFCSFELSHLFERCIWTSMQNLESVALKMTELWVLLYLCIFCTFFTFLLFKFIWTIHTNFHAKSGVSSSKNGWVIALGTKENTIVYIISSVDNTVQTFFRKKC